MPPALMQPVAADDVAAALTDIAVSAPLNGTVEVAGPHPLRLDELVRGLLVAKRDTRTVTADVHARYFGEEIDDRSLIPGHSPRIGPTRFDDWLVHSMSGT